MTTTPGNLIDLSAKTAGATFATLVADLISVAHTATRMTDAELEGLNNSLNELLTNAPKLHARTVGMFEFHQAVLFEHERRTGPTLGVVS